MYNKNSVFAHARIALAIASAFGMTAFTSAEAATKDAVTVSPAASAQTSLNGIISQDKSGQQVIVFKFDKNPPKARVFQLSNPKRLVVDFPGVKLPDSVIAQARDSVGLYASSVSAGSNDERTRFVMRLQEDSEWNVSDVSGNNVTLTLAKTGTLNGPTFAVEPKPPVASPSLSTVAAAGTMPSTSTVAPAATQTASAAPMPLSKVSPSSLSSSSALPSSFDFDVRQFDYKAGPVAGGGRLIVDLSTENAPIDIKSQKGVVVIDFMKSRVPEHLVGRRLDFSNLSTPVGQMEWRQLPDRARLTVKSSQIAGNWDHSAYQVEKRFILEVRPVYNETVSKDPLHKDFKGEKLTLNFQNIEVRSILQVISDFSGLNIVTSDSVNGNITLRLKDVPWDQALDLIMEARGLDKRQRGNVLWIAPRAELRQKEKEAADIRAEQQTNMPVITESFMINYHKAAAIQTMLTTAHAGGSGSNGGNGNQSMLSSKGNVTIDARTNQVFVQDVPERIEAIRQLIKRIDIPVRQVVIDAKIVEANDSFGKSLGAKIGLNSGKSNTANGVGYNFGSSTATTLPYATAGNVPGTSLQSAFADAFNTSLAAKAINGVSPGTFALTLFNSAATRFLNLELSALQADGKGQILSNPRVVASDQQEALIEQGTQIPYQSATSSGATSISFANATLKLKVKPQITPDGNVLMDLEVNKDSVGTTTSAGPAIDTRKVKTQVRIENGGTVVIGGIYSQDETDDTSKVPLLGDLPYLGNLFKTRTVSHARREMLIVITPKVVMDPNQSLNDDAPRLDSEIRPIMINEGAISTPASEQAKKPFLPW